MALYFDYKNSKSLEEANTQYKTTRYWWLLLGIVVEFVIHELGN
jgi:hypothetical protein